MSNADDTIGTEQTPTARSEEKADDPAIHRLYVEVFGRALLASKGGGGSFDWPESLYRTAATTLAISDAFAGRALKTRTALALALRNVVDEKGPNPTHLAYRVESLDLSVRAQNCLDNARIRFVGDLVKKSEADLRKLFGTKTTRELAKALGGIGLRLGMQIDGWTPPPAFDAEAAMSGGEKKEAE